MRLMIILTIMFCFFIGHAIAKPVVSIPKDISITTQNTVDIPIYLSEITDNINGYFLRINYSDQLSHPTVITEGTLSHGHEVLSGPPTDDLGGKIAIGIMAGFQPQTDGLILVIRLTASSDFEQSNVTFVLIKSKLYNALYQEISSVFQNGFIQRIEQSQVHLDINNDQRLNLIDVIMLMNYLIMD